MSDKSLAAAVDALVASEGRSVLNACCVVSIVAAFGDDNIKISYLIPSTGIQPSVIAAEVSEHIRDKGVTVSEKFHSWYSNILTKRNAAARTGDDAAFWETAAVALSFLASGSKSPAVNRASVAFTTPESRVASAMFEESYMSMRINPDIYSPSAPLMTVFRVQGEVAATAATPGYIESAVRAAIGGFSQWAYIEAPGNRTSPKGKDDLSRYLPWRITGSLNAFDMFMNAYAFGYVCAAGNRNDPSIRVLSDQLRSARDAADSEGLRTFLTALNKPGVAEAARKFVSVSDQVLNLTSKVFWAGKATFFFYPNEGLKGRGLKFQTFSRKFLDTRWRFRRYVTKLALDDLKTIMMVDSKTRQWDISARFVGGNDVRCVADSILMSWWRDGFVDATFADESSRANFFRSIALRYAVANAVSEVSN